MEGMKQNCIFTREVEISTREVENENKKRTGMKHKSAKPCDMICWR